MTENPRQWLGRLDRSLAEGPVWIGAPAGYGKTRLVARYLASQERLPVWVSLTEADRSVDAFVLRLVDALGASPWRAPIGEAGGAGDLDALARLAFPQLLAALGQDRILVVDDADRIAGSPAAWLLFRGLRSCTASHRWIVSSRMGLSCWQATSYGVTAIGKRDLQLPPHRCTAMAPAAPTDWLGALQGWPAGLRLLRVMVELPQCPYRPRESQELLRAAAWSILLDAFLASFPARELEALKRLALRASLGVELPEPEVSLGARWCEVLRAGGLIVPRGAAPAVFARPLLDHLAHSPVTALRGGHDRRAMRMAIALERLGRDEDCARALVCLGAHAVLHAMLQRRAGRFEDRGRHAAWLAFANALPADLSRREPDFLLLRGRMLRHHRPDVAERLVDTVAQLAISRGDVLQSILCLCLLVEVRYLRWDDLSEVHRLTPQLEAAIATTGTLSLAAGPRFSIDCRLALARLLTGPDDDCLRRSLHSILARLVSTDTFVATGERLFGWMVLIEHDLWHMPLVARGIMREAIDSTVIDDSTVAPALRVLWRIKAVAWLSCHDVADARLECLIRDARAIALRHGLDALLRDLDHAELERCLARGELSQARTKLEAMTLSLRQHRSLDLAYHNVALAIWYLHAEDFVAACRHVELANQEAARRGMPLMQRPHVEMVMAFALSGAGHHARARLWYDRAVASSGGAPACAVQRTFAEAHASFVECRYVEGQLALRDALSDCARRGAAGYLKHLPKIAAALADRALEADIQATYVRGLILRQGWVAPDAEAAWWPWRLSLLTLGGIACRCDGLDAAVPPLQQRLRELLAALVVAGKDGMSREGLCALLWPGASAASPTKALEITLHRLREWLPDPQAIRAASGRIALDETRVWVDAWALERVCARVESMQDGPAGACKRDAERLVALAAGEFFGDGESSQVIKQVRRRLHRHVEGAVERLMRHSEVRSDVALAERLGMLADWSASSLLTLNVA